MFQNLGKNITFTSEMVKLQILLNYFPKCIWGFVFFNKPLHNPSIHIFTQFTVDNVENLSKI